MHAERDIAMAFQSVRPSVSLSVCLSVRLSLPLSVCQSICLSVRLSVSQSVCLSDRLSLCQSVWLSVCQYVCLSVCTSVCPSWYCVKMNGHIVELCSHSLRTYSTFFQSHRRDKIPRGTLGGALNIRERFFAVANIARYAIKEIVSQAGCPAFRQTNSVRTLARISEHCD